jgi:repressor LexA
LRNVLAISSSTATGWKKGAFPRSDIVINSARYFHVSADYLLGLDDIHKKGEEYASPTEMQLIHELREADEDVRKAAVASMRAVLASYQDRSQGETSRKADAPRPTPDRARRTQAPVLGVAAAGSPIYEEKDDEFVSVPPRYLDSERFFLVQARGDSMLPQIVSGDYVVVQRSALPDPGDIALVRISGPGMDEYAIKRFFPRGETVELRSLNPTFRPMVYSAQDVQSAEKIVDIIPIRHSV